MSWYKTPVDLLGLLQEEGSVPLRRTGHGWQSWQDGAWASDHGKGVRFSYLASLVDLVPEGDEWSKVRRDLTTVHGQAYILRTWAHALFHKETPPLPGAQVDKVMAHLRFLDWGQRQEGWILDSYTSWRSDMEQLLDLGPGTLVGHGNDLAS
jgi:hypothetical protein